jgi:glycosyltransferase involved in cell wall biosynthesis
MKTELTMSDYTPKVSIVTPSYNQAEFLEETILSVQAQDYPNIEHIIIDGGSDDGSVEVIKKYEDSLAYWVSEDDDGQSDAINKGFRKATGDIVAWLNSDDLYFPHAVSTAVKHFQNNANLGLFYADCVFIDAHGDFIRYFTEREEFDLDRLLSFSDFIMQPTTFFSREKLFEVGLLDEDRHFTMDWDLWCRLAKHDNCDVEFEAEVIAANREYAAAKTSAGGWTRLKEIWQHLHEHKTTLFPHAWFGYLASELYLKAKQEPAQSRRECFRILAKMASLGNIVGSLQYRHRVHAIQGLWPHSRSCGAAVHYLLPIYRPVSQVEIVFDSAGVGWAAKYPPRLSITINDEPMDTIVLGQDGASEWRGVLPASVCESNRFDLKLEFERSIGMGPKDARSTYAGRVAHVQLR